MLDSFLNVLELIFDFLKYPLLLVGIIVGIFALITSFYYCILFFVKKERPKKGVHNKLKKRSFLKRIFVDAPRQVARDIMDSDPELFRHQGIVIFCGRQGAGKTISAVQFVRSMQEEYPKAKCLSNLKYKHADGELKSWDDIIDYQNENGPKKGVIILNDEIQNSFNSKESRNFPMEYMQIVTQNRKNRRIIVATAQNFYMLSKDIRSQCTEIRQCFTIARCITIVHVQEPFVNNDGEVEKLKHKRFYFFVQNNELREMYDTYEVIKGFKKTGFLPRPEQKNRFTDANDNTVIIDKKGRAV